MSGIVSVASSGSRSLADYFLSSSRLSIAFIQSQWHAVIVDQARAGFMNEMHTIGVNSSGVDHFQVPGAFEIPLLSKRLAASGHYDAIVCAGLVVDGGIYRHDFVASSVVQGLMQVQLDTEVPVFSVVLTPHHFHEGDLHHRFFYEHFLQKGAEAAHACLTTVRTLRSLPTLK